MLARTWWVNVLVWYGYLIAIIGPIYIIGMGIAWLREGEWRWPPW